MFNLFKKENKQATVWDSVLTIHLKNGKIVTKTYKHYFGKWKGPCDGNDYQFLDNFSEGLFLADDEACLYLYTDIDHVEFTNIPYLVTFKEGYVGLVFEREWEFVSEQKQTFPVENK